MNRLRPIRLTTRNLHQLGVREWGLPTGCYIGKMWRSERHRVAVCLLPIPKDTSRLSGESRRIYIVEHADEQWIPVTWRRAIATYKRQWPDSAPRFHRL